MWGSQPWNQWALQPSMFNNVPHDEIDWAALAKQWIQMQQVPPSADSGHLAQPVPPPPPVPPHPPLPPEEYDRMTLVPPHMKPAMLPGPFRGPAPDMGKSIGMIPEPGPPFVPREPPGNYWHPEWEPGPGVEERMWAPPPPPPDVPAPAEKKTFDYGHMHDSPLAMQTVDYNHVSDHFNYNNQMYVPEDPYDHYWSQVASTPMMPPPFLKKDRVPSYPIEEDSSQTDPSLDAAKRKQLPAWIREGLEKMEQERLKRLEKERSDKEKAETAKKSNNSPKKGLLLSGEGESSSIMMPSKCKFDSDSDHEENEAHPVPPATKQKFLPLDAVKTDEERQREIMLNVKKTLTLLLLEVTNSEILAVCREVYQKAQAKAPARPLASASALRSLASGLGSLASYDSHSESSASDAESVSSDEELRKRIQEKKQRYALKEKKMLAESNHSEEERKEKKRHLSKQDPAPVQEEKVSSDVDVKREDCYKTEVTTKSLPDQSPNKPSSAIPFLEAVANNVPALPVTTAPVLPETLPNEKINNAKLVGAEKSADVEKLTKNNHSDRKDSHKRKESYSEDTSSDSESDSSSSSRSSNYHSDRKSSDKRSRSDRHSDRRKLKKRRESPSKKPSKRKSRDNSSDSSYKNRKYKSEKDTSKRRTKEKLHGSGSSESSAGGERASRHESVRAKRSDSGRSRRSRSYERRKVKKDRSRSRSRKDLHSRKYDNSTRRVKKSYRRSGSRSRSHTPPKRYQRRSRSNSSERDRRSKKSKLRSHDR